VNQTPRIRRISHPEPRPPIDLTQAHELIHRLDMSPDGRWGLLLSDSGPSYLVDLRHPDPASTVLAITSINGTMNRYAFSQDGSWLATAAGPMDKYPELQVHEPEYTVRLHDLGSPARPQEIELKGHEDLVTNIAFSPDGRRLATCSLDRTVRLWDLTELDGLAKVRARLLAEPRDRDALIRTFGFDADNFEHDLERTLESLPGLIDKAASRLRERPQLLLGDDAMIQGCELSSDGAWLVASGQPDEHRACARLWRTGALTSCAAPVRLSREARIDNFQLNQTMAISPDQRWLLILEDCSLWELRPASEVIPVRLRQRGSFSAQVARFSNAGDLLVLSVDKAVIMVRIDEEGSSSPPRVLDTGGQDTRFGYFIPGDRWFVAACGGNVVGEPMDLRLWRAHEIDESGGPLILLEDARQLGECKVSPGGRWLTAWNHDAGHLWDLHHDDPRQAKRTLRGHQSKINAALFSPDERFLVSAGDDGQLLAWDLLRSESAIEPRVLHADAAPLASVVADWQRRRLFVGGNTGRATILTLDSELAAIETRELAALSGPVYAVFHPAGRSLAARDKQGVRIVDLATGAQGAVLADEPGGLQLRRQLDYSPDGRWLIVARQGRIFLIDAQPGAQAEPIELLGHHHEQIEFRGTRDSHWLVTIDRPIDEPQGYQPVQTCRIWDLQSPAPAAASVALPDLPRGVDRIAITDDDRWLVTSSRDGLRLWPLGTQHLIDLAGRSIGREPSDEERRRYAFTAAALQGIE
jgi:WD40 repeat protein